MIFGSDRKKPAGFSGKSPCLKRIRWKYALFCLGNDKNNVIANEVLTYFRAYAASLKYTQHVLGLYNNYCIIFNYSLFNYIFIFEHI